MIDPKCSSCDEICDNDVDEIMSSSDQNAKNTYESHRYL